MSNTIWTPSIEEASRPVYRAIADALERDLAQGVLQEGQRLPTHRELARTLEVTPLTITRAYREATRRGLIESTVGRGTFVRSDVPPLDPAHAERGLLDLSKNVVAGSDHLELDPRIVAALRPVIRESDYQPTAGSHRHRMAAAAWMKRSGVDAPAQRVVITPGAQQAILAILASQCRPGDTLLAESVTYPRLGAIADFLHLKVEPVPIDSHGIIPHALEKMIGKARVLYCVPNFQNPTGSVMPEKRRRELAAIARRNELTIIEDDVYGFLLDPLPPPIVTFAPDRVCFVTSPSKSLTPGLRLGFAVIPESMLDHVTEACGAITAFASSVAAEVFAQLAESGSTDRCIAAKRELIVRNRHAAERALGTKLIRGHAMSPHVWLTLPPGCDSHDLAERARQRGIAVAPGTYFTANRTSVPNAVRVSIGSTTDTRALETALRTLAVLIAAPRMGAGAVV